MNKLEVKDNYADVTKKWLNTATPNSHKVKEQPYFDYNCVRYKVDNKNVVLDYSKEELEMAYFLEKKFGGEMYMLPRINKPDGIKTADYLWRGEYWDLKNINGISKQTIYHTVRKNKRQSHNFIFHIKINLPEKDLKYQIDELYNRNDLKFLDKIIIIKKNKIKIFQRKKDATAPQSRHDHIS